MPAIFIVFKTIIYKTKIFEFLSKVALVNFFSLLSSTQLMVSKTFTIV